jgi:RNA-binding protein YhbY
MFESAVLNYVIAEHPAQLTKAELLRAMISGAKEPARESEEIRNALRELVGSGLLRLQGEEVVATRATLHFDRLASE